MNAINLLKDFVSIPSLSGREQQAAAYLVSAMKSFGMAAEVDAVGNAVGVRERLDSDGQITRRILLLGHMDTVPGEIEVLVEDGVLVGRGAVDAKGPLAALIAAAARTQLLPGTRLVVIGAVEEESATSKGARFVARQYQPDACIIGEPSGWDGVTLGYKGRILLEYDSERPVGHTAGKEAGAAELAVIWWNELVAFTENYNRDRERLFDQLLPSLRHIQTESDGLVETVKVRVGVRLPPAFDIESFTMMAIERAGEARLRTFAYEPAFQSSRRSPLAGAFNQVFRHSQIRPHFKLKTGTSDMNVVGPVWNCPIVAYGPGDSQLDHTPTEHIILSEYERAIRILVDVLELVQRKL